MSKKSTKTIIPRDRRVLMRKCLKIKKRKPTQKIHQKLIDIELKLQESYSNERRSQETNATSKIKANPKYFLFVRETLFKTQTEGWTIEVSKNQSTDK